ncbi:MAG: heme-copper oxidase subunit III [Deltaproteobacteria bacterium]|nr:heme-copper oxidase subunit III [Deltaproteobacteria bacterium]
MTTSTALRDPRKNNLNAIVGMIYFITTETLVFAGMLYMYLSLRNNMVNWPPPGQPRLPVEVTWANTMVLLASGVFLILAGKGFYGKSSKEKVLKHLGIGTALGVLFLGIQGFEWIRLIGFGLTFSGSMYGGLFYLLIGTHAVHAVTAMGFLIWAILALKAADDMHSRQNVFIAAQMFWLFVVGVWPMLFVLVYLL